jgi:hypothetical protein
MLKLGAFLLFLAVLGGAGFEATLRPWSLLAAVATFVPIGLLYLGLRRARPSEQPMLRKAN